MCFSAPVSFTAGATLAAIGLLTLKKARTRRDIPLASIPLLFAGQQAVEGLLWLALLRGETGAWPHMLTQVYAAFAGMAWPTLIPFSLLVIEPGRVRRRWIMAVFLTGTLVAAFTLYAILRFGIQSEIARDCILYQYPGDEGMAMLLPYLAATCTAFFLSSHRDMFRLGLVNLAGFAGAYYFYRFNYASVWCFFAALISGFIYLHFSRTRLGGGDNH